MSELHESCTKCRLTTMQRMAYADGCPFNCPELHCPNYDRRTPAPDQPAAVQVLVMQEDADNYCEILRILAMEEEGDPVAEVKRLSEADQRLAEKICETQAQADPVAEPVLLQYRYKESHHQTVNFGDWYSWEGCTPEKFAEIEIYIAKGYGYEVRKLYTQPQRAAVPDEYEILAVFMRAGLFIQLGQNYSVVGQIAQLLKGANDLLAAAPAKAVPDSEIDRYLDAVLKASGSALRHYTLNGTIEKMRAAMRSALAAPEA